MIERSRSTHRVGGRLTLATFSYAGLLTARVFKQDDRWDVLPLDLTILFALLVVWFSLRAAIRNPRVFASSSRELLVVLVLFAGFAVGVLNMASTQYADEKVLGIYSFGLIAALAPFLLLRSVAERRAFFNAIVFIGIALGVETMLLSAVGFSAVGGRVPAFGGVPIWSGRLAGAGLIVLTIRLLFRRSTPFPVVVLSVILGVGLAASGSRGPLLGLIVALGAVAIYAWQRLPYGKPTLRAMFPLVALITVLVAFAIPRESIDRLLYVFDEGVSQSERERFDLYGAAVDGITHHPFGVGWGSFDGVVRDFDLQALNRQDVEAVYAHNLLLEVTVEAGWVPSIVLMLALFEAFRRVLHAEPSEDTLTVLALLAFFLVNASFSGDINANRWVPALLGVILAGFGPVQRLGRRSVFRRRSRSEESLPQLRLWS